MNRGLWRPGGKLSTDLKALRVPYFLIVVGRKVGSACPLTVRPERSPLNSALPGQRTSPALKKSQHVFSFAVNRFRQLPKH